MSDKNRMKNLRNTLMKYSSLTDILPSQNMHIGYQNNIDDFPAISITQVGGPSTGQLGYNETTNSTVRGNFSVQINIYSDKSAFLNFKIQEELKDILISSGYERSTNVDGWEDTFNAHEKVTRWIKTVCE